ncbi:MAG: hypothetical protein H6730_33870 [Deltaproteobacteria bacterium]|nr:hypothetical protein [Deltaproteobacteria bacterium]
MGMGLLPRPRAALFVGLMLLAPACVSEPELEGRACGSTAPCPEPLMCGVDRTCHFLCDGFGGCPDGRVCADDLCYGTPCASTGDCAEGEVCVTGTCTPDRPPECEEDADCTLPGICEIVEGARCEQGRCEYRTLSCLDPPPAQCAGADDLFRTFAGVGVCDPATGGCDYSMMETACPSCVDTCLAPCSNLTCDDDAGGCKTGGFCEPGAVGEPATCRYQLAPDGMACTLDSGDPGTCKAGACGICQADADCDDGNACTADTCDLGAHVCRHAPVAGTCDDQDLCTTGDTCSDGVCRGQPAVTCDSPPGPCFEAAGRCDPGTGTCAYTTSVAGAPCTDDNRDCTLDVCDGNGACTHDDAPAGTACQDGDLCTYADVCDGNGTCGGTALTCTDAAGVCGANRSCDGTPRCVETFPGPAVSCDDGNACSFSDGCNGAGGCQGTTYSCNDGDLCTQDTCDGQGGCSYTALAPSGLAPTGGGDVSRQDVTLVWSPCTQATQYEVQIQWQAADGTWNAYYTYQVSTNTKLFYPCSSTAPSPPCNSDFRFRVRAQTNGVYGPFSGWAVFHWAACRAC